MSAVDPYLGPAEVRRRETAVSAIAETLRSVTSIRPLVNLRVHVDETIDARIAEVVRKERQRHVPWARIGDALGISGQAASRKFKGIR